MAPPAVKRDIHGRLLDDKDHPVDSFGRKLDLFDRPKEDRIVRPLEELPFASFPNVIVAYPAFLDWVAIYNPRKNGGFGPTKERYEEFKNSYQRRITAMLREISGRASGKALLAETNAVHRKISILPIDFVSTLDLWIKFHDNAIAKPTEWVSAVALGMHASNSHNKDTHATTNFKGKGAGSDVEIFFSPERVRPGGPGFNPDEILFHETVHAVRASQGAITAGFRMSNRHSNEEEFAAVVATNVYLSEKKQTVFRANHSRDVLRNPAKFLDSPDVPAPGARSLLGGFRHRQPRFFAALAGIDAKTAAFNPFRQLAEETKKASAAHDAKMREFDRKTP